MMINLMLTLLLLQCGVAPLTFVSGQQSQIWCEGPYALCAYANCTVNDDAVTADCGCYAFDVHGGEGMEDEEQQLSSMSIIELIPHAKIKSQTMAYCEASDCDNATSTGAAPLCESIRVGELWPSPTADLVSTWSDELAEENGVDDEPSWSCPAAPGRFIPVCMLAPCMYKNAGETNPYNAGMHNVTCTCPLVEATVAYNVYGGLRDPCSLVPTQPGAYVQAAGGAILAEHVNNQSRVLELWNAVGAAFNGGDGDADESLQPSSAAFAAAISYVAFLSSLVCSLALHS